jgi:WD40 repeat protein
MKLTENRIVTVMFPPEEDTLLIVSEDDVQRFDLADGQEISNARRVITGLANKIYQAVLTPDGKQMISTSYYYIQVSGEDTVLAWGSQLPLSNLDTGTNQTEWVRAYTDEFGFGEPQLIKISGKLAVAGVTQDNVLRIWDVASNEVLRKIELLETPQQVIFSPEVDKAAIVGNGVISVLDTKTGKVITSMPDFSPGINQLLFSPAGDMMAAFGYDNNTWLWELESGQVRAFLDGEMGYQSSAAFNEDGAQLLVFSNQSRSRSIGLPQIQIWETASGASPDTLDYDEKYNTRLFSTATILSHNGQFAASGYRNNTARVWDVQALHEGEEVQPVDIGTSIPTINLGLAFSPDNSLLAVAGTQEIGRQGSDITRRLLVGVWNRQTGEEVKQRFELPFKDSILLRSPELAFSPDNSTLLFSTEFGVYVWQLEGDAEPRRIEYSESVQTDDNLVDQTLYGFNFSPDGTVLATRAGGSVQFWDVEQLVSGEASEPFYRWMPESSGAWQLTFSSDGKYIATSGGDGLIRLWGVTE